MTYRKKYEIVTGEKLNNKIEVHHIDADRGNNDISNLVAIPKAFHSQLHKSIRLYKESIDLINECGYLFKSEHKDVLKKINQYIEIKSLLFEYISKRDYLIHINTK